MQLPSAQLILAQAIPGGTSEYQWWGRAVSDFTGLLVAIAGALIFLCAWLLLATRRRNSALAAYLLMVPIPVVICLIGQMSGMLSSLLVIAATPDRSVPQSDLASGFATTMAQLLFAIMVTIPTYVLLAIALLVRTTAEQRTDE